MKNNDRGDLKETPTSQCSQCRAAIYGAALHTWHYGQTVAAGGEDGHADGTQDFFFSFDFFFVFP